LGNFIREAWCVFAFWTGSTSSLDGTIVGVRCMVAVSLTATTHFAGDGCVMPSQMDGNLTRRPFEPVQCVKLTAFRYAKMMVPH
jgi:hypothetical protein